MKTLESMACTKRIMNPKVRTSQQRGAVFVEALIVCSFFVMCFIGLVFFRELYTAKLRVSRLARASALNHAMNACRGAPETGLERDLPQGPVDRTAQSGSRPLDSTRDGRSEEILGGLDRSKSGGLFYSLAEIGVSAEARTGKKQREGSDTHAALGTTVKTTSFVACGDVVTSDQFSEILPHLESVFDSMF